MIQEKLKNIKDIPQKKLKIYAVMVIIIAVILTLYISTITPPNSAAEGSSMDDSLEERLKDALESMQGVKRVSVVINYDSTAELVPATSNESSSQNSVSDNSTNSSVSTSENVAYVSGDALIIKENQPKVRGVIVIAEGAQDIAVRNSILRAVMTLLNVTADKVEILY